MKKISKILFTDLDNTLLNRQKRITSENRRAIEQAVAQGHRVVICTGRPLIGAAAQIRKLNLVQPGCYAITCNGAVIYDCFQEEILFQKTLPFPYVKYIFEKARQYDLFCQTYSDTHLLAPYASPAMKTYVAKSRIPYRILPGLPDCLKEEPAKVLVLGQGDRKRLEAYREDIREWAEDKISVFYSDRTYLEHVFLGVSKGSAIKWLCSHLEIPLEHTVAVGDAQNDIPMLRTARTGIAMANAVPECRASADYITENDCEHSGVAEVIHKFLL